MSARNKAPEAPPPIPLPDSKSMRNKASEAAPPAASLSIRKSTQDNATEAEISHAHESLEVPPISTAEVNTQQDATNVTVDTLTEPANKIQAVETEEPDCDSDTALPFVEMGEMSTVDDNMSKPTSPLTLLSSTPSPSPQSSPGPLIHDQETSSPEFDLQVSFPEPESKAASPAPSSQSTTHMLGSKAASPAPSSWAISYALEPRAASPDSEPQASLMKTEPQALLSRPQRPKHIGPGTPPLTPTPTKGKVTLQLTLKRKASQPLELQESRPFSRLSPSTFRADSPTKIGQEELATIIQHKIIQHNPRCALPYGLQSSNIVLLPLISALRSRAAIIRFLTLTSSSLQHMDSTAPTLAVPNNILPPSTASDSHMLAIICRIVQLLFDNTIHFTNSRLVGRIRQYIVGKL